MTPCPYVELKYRVEGTWAAQAATLCALPEDHGGFHVMQSGRELRKWDIVMPVVFTGTTEIKWAV